jgi:hypothetical protein
MVATFMTFLVLRRPRRKGFIGIPENQAYLARPQVQGSLKLIEPSQRAKSKRLADYFIRDSQLT